MSQRIEFIDKQQGKDLPAVPIEKKLTFEDANEIKAVVNAHADELEALVQSVEFASEISPTGADGIVFAEKDDTTNGDGTESQFIRQNNKLFYLVSVEQ